ncbi:MAG: ATP-binding cassette domain-containing protein [Mycobacteriales bacterium]
MPDAIVAAGLVKHYGSVKALDGLDLLVPEGTIMALLGPNGAGKTTAVRVLTTLLPADSGEATVAGFDVRRDGARLREVIGLSGQYAAVDENLTGFENLDMVGRLYQLGRTKARARATELLERFDLVESANRPAKTYSGGMRRRLDLAGSLVGEPKVLFLDEPTTGLDPRSRMEMWEVIGELVRGGTTLLLTTQYLEEADRLADRIAVIDRGKVIALGTADELKSQLGGERLEVTVSTDAEVPLAVDVLRGVGLAEPKSEGYSRAVSVAVSGGPPVLIEALRQLDEVGVKVVDVGIHRPTLDDVFLSLTGRDTTEGEQA